MFLAYMFYQLKYALIGVLASVYSGTRLLVLALYSLRQLLEDD